MDFLIKQRHATGLVETAGRTARAGGKQQPARCLRKTQHKFAIASMVKKLLHRCIGVHARVHVYFLRRVCMHFDRCCKHRACAGVYCIQAVRTSVYTFAYTLATGCAYALMYVQFVHLALGNEDGGVQLVNESTCCLVWRVIFDRRKDRGVVCVFSIFDAGGSVCECMWVYTHTHTHTAQMGYSVVSPRVGMRHLEGLKTPDGLNLGIHIFVYVYKVHMCIQKVTLFECYPQKVVLVSRLPKEIF